MVPRKFVEAEEQRVKTGTASGTETAEVTSLEEFVREVPVERASEETERQIEIDIDPKAHEYRQDDNEQ